MLLLLLLKFICSCTCTRTIAGQQQQATVTATTTTKSNLHKLLSVQDVIFPIQQLHKNTSSENMNSFQLWVSVCTSSEKLTELFTSSETGGYIWYEGTPHLKSWESCSLHLKMGGISDLRVHLIWKVEWVVNFIWNQGVYLIWGYTSSEKLSKLFTSSEIGGLYLIWWYTNYTNIYTSAKFGVVVCKGSMLDCGGVNLPWVYMHCSIYI